MFKFLKKAVLCSALISSSIVTPLLAKEKNVEMAVRVEKTIIKLLRAEYKQPEKMVQYCKEIRREIEKKFGFKFYVKNFLDWSFEIIEKECGQQIPVDYYSYYRTIFKAKPDSLYENVFQVHVDEDEYVYEKSFNMNKSVGLPSARFTLGVSMILSGLYLDSAREPIYTFWGIKLVQSGVDVCKSSFPVIAEQKPL